MIVLEWTLIVGFVLSLALCTVALIRAFKEGFTRRWIAVLVLGLGFLFIIYLIYYSDKIEPASQAQIMLMVGLLAVTGAYALSAARQAEASAKMAKHMVKPRLMPDLYLEGSFFEGRRVKLNAMVNNDGEGPAYDVELWIEDDSKPPSKLIIRDYERAVLRSGDSTSWVSPSPYLDFPHSDMVQRRFFVIKYRDIDGEHEIRQPFVLTTVENDKPYARREPLSKRTLKKQNLEDELP